MGRSSKLIVILFFLVSALAGSVHGQNYRDQKKLIRLKPNNLLVFGQVNTHSGNPLTGASISLFDPSIAKVVETIPVDDLGEYLFTLEKGRTFGLIIEKEGLFPYYTKFTVPLDLVEEWEHPINLPDGLKNRYELYYSNRLGAPSNEDELEELLNALSKYQDLLIWIPEESDSDFPSRYNSIRDIFSEAGIETYRIIAGPPPDDMNQFISLRLINEYLPADTLVNENIEERTDKNPDDSVSEPLSSAEEWTLQFIASKNKLSDSALKGLKDFKIFVGKDGYFRYTFGNYKSKEEADKGKVFLKSKGFNQAFAKKIEDLQKL